MMHAGYRCAYVAHECELVVQGSASHALLARCCCSASVQQPSRAHTPQLHTLILVQGHGVYAFAFTGPVGSSSMK